jgi:predicted Fe-Mo cluster-binding NifX family protein
MMGNHGIQVVRGCSGDVRAAAEQWLAGSVVDSGLTCESHERECEQ